MPEQGFTTEYVFKIVIEGATAVEQAKEFRDRIGQELGAEIGGRGTGAQQLKKIRDEWVRIPLDVDKATSSIDKFNAALNRTTLQFFGLRRLTFQLAIMGRTIERMGEQTLSRIENLSNMFLSLSYSATRAAIAMNLPIELMGELRQAVMDASAALGYFTPEEVADGLRRWAAGTGEVVTSAEQLNRIVADTVDIQNLAMMAGENLGETMVYVGAVMSTYGMSIDEVSRITQVLYYVSATTWAEVRDLGEAFKFIGPIADQLGVSFEETTVALGLLAEANIRGSRAGRAMRQMFVTLLDPTEKAQKALNRMFSTVLKGNQTWRDLFFPEDEFIGFAEVIDLLSAATEQLTEAETAQALATIFTTNALPAAIKLVKDYTKAREYGINLIHAALKAMEGIIDAETLAFQRFVEDVTGMPYTIESVEQRWGKAFALMEEDTSRHAAQIKQEWENAMRGIGEAAWLASEPWLERQKEIIKGLEEIIDKYPEAMTLIMGFGVSAKALGGLTAITGQMATMAVNVYIAIVAIKALRPLITGVGAKFIGLATTISPVVAEVGFVALMIAALIQALQNLPAAFGVASSAVSDFLTKLREGEATGEDYIEILDRLYEAFDELGPGAGDVLPGVRPSRVREIQTSLEELREEMQDGTATWRDYADVVADSVAAVLSAIPGMGALAPVVDRLAGSFLSLGTDARDAAQGVNELADAVIRQGLIGMVPGVAPTIPPVISEEQEEILRGIVEETDRYARRRAEREAYWIERIIETEEQGQTRRGDAIQSFFEQVDSLTTSYHRQSERSEEDHQLRLAEMAESHGWRIADILKALVERKLDIEENYHTRREEIISSYNARLAELTLQNSDRAADITQRYHDKVADYEENFRKRMERMELDHQWKMEDLIRGRDARGLLNEMRSHRRRVREANEDRDDWHRKAARDYQKQIDALNKALAKQREAQKKALADQLAKLEEDRKKRLKDAEEGAEKQLRNANRSYGRQVTRLKEHQRRMNARREADFEYQKNELQRQLELQLREIEYNNEDRVREIERARDEERETEEREHWATMAVLAGLAEDELDLDRDTYEARLALLRQFLWARRALFAGYLPPGYRIQTPEWWTREYGRYTRGNEPPGYQHGGYAPHGTYRLGEEGREFILSAPTTTLMERALGPLSQGKVVSFAQQGGGGGRGGIDVTVNQNFRFQGSFTAEERSWFKRTAREQSYQAVVDVLTAVGG